MKMAKVLSTLFVLGLSGVSGTLFSFNVFEGASESVENNKAEKINLDDYSKTVHEETWEDEKNLADMILLETIDKENGFTRKYKLVLNGKESEVVEDYTVTDSPTEYYVDNKDITFVLTVNGKEIDNRTDSMIGLDIGRIEDFKDDKNFVLFRKDYFTIFKGETNNEYLIYERHFPSPWKCIIYSQIYDEDFNLLSVKINETKVDNFFTHESLGTYSNMLQYSEEIGYKSKDLKDYADHKFFCLVNGELRYVDFTFDISAFMGTASEYKIIVNNSKLEIILLKKHEIIRLTSER